MGQPKPQRHDFLNSAKNEWMEWNRIQSNHPIAASFNKSGFLSRTFLSQRRFILLRYLAAFAFAFAVQRIVVSNANTISSSSWWWWCWWRWWCLSVVTRSTTTTTILCQEKSAEVTDQMEESRGTLIFVFVVDQRTNVENFLRLAVGLLQNLRPQCKFDDRLVTTGDRFCSFLNEFSSCVVDSENIFSVRGIVAEFWLSSNIINAIACI